MRKSYIGFVAVIVGIIAFVPTFGSAQTSTPTQTTASQQTNDVGPASTMQVVATVNIYNAKIVSQTGNTFSISFDFNNRIGVQSGIKYSASLADSSGATVDEKVYNEVIVLGENQTIHKTIEYTPSTALSAGKYEIWLRSQNENGLPLASASLGEVTLTAIQGVSTVEILPSTCYLTVNADKTKYILNQGVDIANTEILTVSCSVFSTFKGTASFNPIFETRARNIFGNKVDQTGGATGSISIKQGTSTISLALPKALSPQAYDVLLTLVSSDGSNKSNTIVSHYVLRGVSGTIQNNVFDKTSYKAGDTANLKVLISEPADNFFNSRAKTDTVLTNKTIKVVITDIAGIVCGSTTKSMTANDSNYLTVAIPITIDCVNPSANITFSAASSNGTQQVLDSKNFTTPPEPPQPSTNTSDSLTYIIIIIIICLLILAIIIKKYEKNLKK